MSFLSILATIVGIVMALSGFPQAIKIFKRKSAKDISAITYLTVDLGAIVWILYGLELKSFALIISNFLAMVTSTTILLGYYLYGRTVK